MRTKNIFKKAAVTAMAGAMLMSSAMTAQAAAGQWKQDNTGWWWERFGGWYPTNEWLWIDGNNDGTAECYRFDSNGYRYENTTTPDGYTVNADGAWTEDGVVQIQITHSNLHDVGMANIVGADMISGAVTDGKNWPQMTFDETLDICLGTTGEVLFPGGMTKVDQGYFSQGYWGPTYTTQYKGQALNVLYSKYSDPNTICGYFGKVSAFFDNFPEQGMELNAFYDNTGYESLAWGRLAHGTTGDSDQIFGLPQGSYRMGAGSIEEKFNYRGFLYIGFSILLSQGTDGKYYIFPDSLMEVY